MQEIVTLITNLGFPIAVSLGLGAFIYKFIERIQNENQQREDKLMACLDKFGDSQKAIAQNLESMNERLLDIEKKIGV